jgi:tetratricopeptide (TPR) repeat protein
MKKTISPTKKWGKPHKLHFFSSAKLFPVNLVFVVLVCCLPFKGQTQHAELEAARQLAINGQHQAAETQLAALLQQYPGFQPAQLLRSHNHAWGKQYALAIQGFQQVLEKDPDNHDALIGLGYAYAWSGDTPKALYPFSKAQRVQPGSVEARKGLGHTYLIAGNGTAAAKVFKDLVKQFPEQSSYFMGLGQAYILKDEIKNARKALSEALSIDPNNKTAQELLDRMRTEASVLEFDAWGGYSNVGGDQRYGLRILQASYQFDPKYTLYARYDNTLSLDNIDFVTRRNEVPAAWVGSFAGWNSKFASRLEVGRRFFSNRNDQQLVKAEQVFYTKSAFNIRVGGFAGFSSDLPTEWYGYTSMFVPLGKIFSLEPSYFYTRDGVNPNPQHRALLAAKLRHPKGFELTVGGFYGKPNLNIEGVKDQISGGYAIALIPFSKIVWGQLAINHEDGVFDQSTVFAAGLKVRMER